MVCRTTTATEQPPRRNRAGTRWSRRLRQRSSRPRPSCWPSFAHRNQVGVNVKCIIRMLFTVLYKYNCSISRKTATTLIGSREKFARRLAKGSEGLVTGIQIMSFPVLTERKCKIWFISKWFATTPVDNAHNAWLRNLAGYGKGQSGNWITTLLGRR